MSDHYSRELAARLHQKEMLRDVLHEQALRHHRSQRALAVWLGAAMLIIAIAGGLLLAL